MSDGTSDMATVGDVPAVANLPRDLAIIKMENDNIMAAAAAHPRNYPAVLADLKSQLATFKAFAEEAMYCKPVGKERVMENGKMVEREKYARGLSIRSAEAIRVAFKYMGVTRNVEMIDDMHARIEASAIDYQTGNLERMSRVVSREYKSKYGGMAVTPIDRFLNTTCLAELSKLVRNCIVAIVSPGLRAELERSADEQLDEFLDENTVKKIVAQFSAKGVTADNLESHFGKRLGSFTKEDRKTLVGIWKALEDGETTVADVFGENTKSIVEAPKRKEQGAEPVAPKSDAEVVAETAPVDAASLMTSIDQLIESLEPENIPIRRQYREVLFGKAGMENAPAPQLMHAIRALKMTEQEFNRMRPKSSKERALVLRQSFEDSRAD